MENQLFLSTEAAKHVISKTPASGHFTSFQSSVPTHGSLLCMHASDSLLCGPDPAHHSFVYFWFEWWITNSPLSLIGQTYLKTYREDSVLPLHIIFKLYVNLLSENVILVYVALFTLHTHFGQVCLDHVSQEASWLNNDEINK